MVFIIDDNVNQLMILLDDCCSIRHPLNQGAIDQIIYNNEPRHKDNQI